VAASYSPARALTAIGIRPDGYNLNHPGSL
jgi:hypothetical protein